jgi:hypothetical protein
MRTPILLLLLVSSAFALAQDVQPTAVSQRFDGEGIRIVVLRGGNAITGTVVNSRFDVKEITVSATPSGGATGYHPADPNWKETKAADWGMSFVSQRFGDTLIISTKNEMSYMHHYYAFAAIGISVPPKTKVILEPRQLSGDGAPDLAAQ